MLHVGSAGILIAFCTGSLAVARVLCGRCRTRAHCIVGMRNKEDGTLSKANIFYKDFNGSRKMATVTAASGCSKRQTFYLTSGLLSFSATLGVFTFVSLARLDAVSQHTVRIELPKHTPFISFLFM